MIRKVVGHDIGHVNQVYRALRSVRIQAGLDVVELDAAYLAMDHYA